MFEALFKYSPADYARGELIYAGDWPTWLVNGLFVAALALIALFLFRRHKDAHWLRLGAIGVLQVAMVALVLWALMQPTLTTDRLRDGENTVAVVLDSSASMAYGLEESRLAAAKRNLANVSSADRSNEFSLRHYELGAGVQLVDNFVASTAVADGTAIPDGLVSVLEGARFNPLAAVVLGSDGADTGGGLTAEALAEIAAFGVPIHTIGIGRERMPEDIELQEVVVPDKVLPGSTVAARVTVRHDATAATEVKVYDGDDLLDIVPIELPLDTTVTTAWVEVELTEPGPHQLSFSVDGVEGETEFRNNRRATLVNVANERYRVLYFEGEPRWEYKFMRRAVADDDDLSIATLLRVSPNKFYRQGIDGPEQLESGFPTTRDELFGYDALIIGSVEAASLSEEQQMIVRDFVSERGGSLLMIAGPNGLGNGGWGQSGIADVLPARLPPSTSNTFYRRKAPVSPTPQGLAEQMMRLAADDDGNKAAWQALPEVADYQVVGNLKPAAVTLLEADTEDGRIPLFVTQPFGRGQAYILSTGGTWRWQMSMPLDDLSHETFWRQALRAMVATAPDNVSLTVEGGESEGTVSLRAEFRDDAFRPVDDIGVSVVASHEDGDSTSLTLVPDESEPGVFVAEIEPSASGTWYFEAVAERNGEPIAVSRSSLLFESGQAEFFNIRRDSGLLRRISEATGGRYFEADNLDGLADLLRYSSSGITETEYRPIWDAPAVFLLLLLLKAGEWLIRRRWSSI